MEQEIFFLETTEYYLFSKTIRVNEFVACNIKTNDFCGDIAVYDKDLFTKEEAELDFNSIGNN